MNATIAASMAIPRRKRQSLFIFASCDRPSSAFSAFLYLLYFCIACNCSFELTVNRRISIEAKARRNSRGSFPPGWTSRPGASCGMFETAAPGRRTFGRSGTKKATRRPPFTNAAASSVVAAGTARRVEAELAIHVQRLRRPHHIRHGRTRGVRAALADRTGRASVVLQLGSVLSDRALGCGLFDSA